MGNFLKSTFVVLKRVSIGSFRVDLSSSLNAALTVRNSADDLSVALISFRCQIHLHLAK